MERKEPENEVEQVNMCASERQMTSWELCERIAKGKQRDMISAAQEIMDIEQLSDWLSCNRHKTPENIERILLRIIARSDR